MTDQTAIESVLNEDRIFPPPAKFAANAHIKSFEEYERIYAEADADVPAFWAKQAAELDWFKKWDTVLEWDLPHAKWFVGGKLNITYNWAMPGRPKMNAAASSSIRPSPPPSPKSSAGVTERQCWK